MESCVRTPGSARVAVNVSLTFETAARQLYGRDIFQGATLFLSTPQRTTFSAVTFICSVRFSTWLPCPTSQAAVSAVDGSDIASLLKPHNSHVNVNHM